MLKNKELLLDIKSVYVSEIKHIQTLVNYTPGSNAKELVATIAVANRVI